MACKKSDKMDSILFETPYSINRSLEMGKIRVFTQAGELKNGNLVAQYAAAESDNLNGYVDQILQLHTGIDTITFGSAGEASAIENYSRITYTVSSNGSQLELSTKDDVNRYCYFDVYSKTILYSIVRLKPLFFEESLFSSIPQYTFKYRSQEKLIAIPKGTELHLPLLTFAWFNRLPTTAGNYFYNKYNELDPSFYKSIPKGDTVIVKETMIVYSR